METELQKIQENLKKEIPYKWRVQSFSQHKPEATCVAYINSRDVQDILDESCVWSDRYYSENNMLFCEITIYADGREYKRSDTGSESQSDAEKGHSSDAFKRAAVKFGVGRFLYSIKMQKIAANEKKVNGKKPHVVDSKGKRVWDLTSHLNNISAKPKQEARLTVDRQLNRCKTLEELKMVYASLTPAEKKAWVILKDSMKNKLTPKSA